MGYLSDGLKVTGFLLAPKTRQKKLPVLTFNRGGNREFVPVLILHGEDDSRVKVTQAKKLPEKLFELVKEHELLTFPKADHALNTHRAERNAKIFEFFAKHLR